MTHLREYFYRVQSRLRWIYWRYRISLKRHFVGGDLVVDRKGNLIGIAIKRPEGTAIIGAGHIAGFGMPSDNKEYVDTGLKYKEMPILFEKGLDNGTSRNDA